MSFTHPVLIAAVVAVLAGTTLAAPTATIAPASLDEPVDVVADQMEMDFAGKLATCTGNVEITTADLRLTAKEVVIHLTDTQQIREVVATGDVEIVQQATGRRANSGKAIYDVSDGRVVLSLDPVLNMDGNILRNADQITYYLRNDKVITKSSNADGKPRQVITFPGKAATPVTAKDVADHD